jgi:hypothetical protein
MLPLDLGSFGNPVEGCGTNARADFRRRRFSDGLATHLKKNDSVLRSVAFVTFGVKAATV